MSKHSKGKKTVTLHCDCCEKPFTTLRGEWPEGLCHFCKRCERCGHALRCVMREEVEAAGGGK